MHEYRVPRLAFVWLLLTQSFLLIPHLIRFPLLLIPLWLICSFWRVMIFKGRWGSPSSSVKTLLVILSVFVIMLFEKRWLNVEATILTLLVAFLLKLIETKNRRDLLVIIYLSYFVIVAQLILAQEMLSGFYLIVSLLLVTTTLIANQTSSDEVTFYYPFRESAKVLVFSLPVMLVGFIVFPRLDPLWTVPIPAGTGKTGVSGTMSPGMFSGLAKSDQVAFRVKFLSDIPALKDMYWRGIVLTQFDGQTWLPIQEDSLEKVPDDIIPEPENFRYRYQVTMEPSQREWMFPLEGTIVADANSGALFLRDFTLKHDGIIDQRQSWYFESVPDAIKGQEIYRYHFLATTQLPKGFNPKTRELAARISSQSSSDRDYITRVLDYFRTEEFFYTLSPPLLGKNSVDDFLFVSRRGFCEHYAAAFVVLMRSAGIPARVVAGYQGGNINPYEKNVTVRQLDAHAWTEVWLKDKGWIKFDPIYAVAPSRIENGSQESLKNDSNFLADSPFSVLHWQNLQWLTKLQYRVDQMNFLWQTWVLGYEGSRQQNLIEKLLGDASLRSIAIFIGSVFGIVSFLILAYFSYRYRPPALSKSEKIYRIFLRKIAKKGIKKNVGEGAFDFQERAISRWPNHKAIIQAITMQYIQLNYAKLPDKAEESRLLKKFRHDVITFYLK